MSPRWHGLRVAFVAFHALAVTLLSVPSPVGARQDSTWTDPHVRQQVLGGLEPFRGLLGDRDDDAVIALARELSSSFLDLRDAVIAPFLPYTRAVGAGQGWQMFGSLNDRPARLRIRVASSVSGPWQTIYLARDPELAWRRELMDEERTRALVNNWSWERDRSQYKLFTKRWARLVAEDHPEAAVVEFAMMRFKVPAPDELQPGVDPPARESWVERVAVPAQEPR